MLSSNHWNIISSWSQAGIGTSFVLELNPGSEQQRRDSSTTKTHRIAFDMGATPSFEDAIPAKHVFLSHGHIDHVGALFSHARARAVAFGGGGAATYFVPAQLLSRIEQCRDAMSELDASNNNRRIQLVEDGMRENNNNNNDEGGGTMTKRLLKMNLIPVHDGDEIPLKGIHYDSKTSFFMRAFSVDHAGHPALAYVIVSRTAAGVKEEYQHLDKEEMRKLIKSGVSVKAEPTEKIEIAYTGDTCANGLILHHPSCNDEAEGGLSSSLSSCCSNNSNIGQLFQAELLLCELTYLDSSENEEQRCKAVERGHIHINDLERIFSSHINTWDDDDDDASAEKKKKVVFYHLSIKYQPCMRALDFIIEGLPRQILRHYDCYVAIVCRPEQIIGNGSDDETTRSLFRPRSGCISLERYRNWKNKYVAA